MRRPALLVFIALAALLTGCVVSAPSGTGPAETTTAPVPSASPSDADIDRTPPPKTNATPPGPPTAVPLGWPDPASDRLGWEAGYWANETLAVSSADGLNASERSTVVARAMARVELIRNLEFHESVPVTVESRAADSLGLDNRSTSPALRAFDNAKFEALFLIGEDDESVETQAQTLNKTVQGAYSRARESIVLISDSDAPRLRGETTLAHELVHALQDQHFETPPRPGTRDAYNGQNGLFEGDATVVHRTYGDRCGATWRCIGSDGGDRTQAARSPPHFGLYFLEYFPYESGPALIDYLRANGGWAAVDDAYEAPPRSARPIIEPSRYGTFEPTAPDAPPTDTGEWERVRPPGRPASAVLGQSALASAFAYTLYDSYNSSSTIAPETFLNFEGMSLNTSDPLEYSLPFLHGWTGERLHVYQRDDSLGYVWHIGWERPADARRFTAAYRDLLAHWGGHQTGQATWQVAADSPFGDSFRITVRDSTVTIVNGPTAGAVETLSPDS